MVPNKVKKTTVNNGLFYFRKQVFLAILLLTITFIANCVQYETQKVEAIPSASQLLNIYNPLADSSYEKIRALRAAKDRPTISITPILAQTSTMGLTILGRYYDPTMDLHAGPVSLPLRILIPSLNVDASVLGVGLTKDNNMDAPKGLYGDPNWSSAFWYRGSAIPGEPGTATIAGHVNGLLGEPETFAHIRRLKTGDTIIIKVTNTDMEYTYIVDEVKKYSLTELASPEINDRIFGDTTSSNGHKLKGESSHLTLITCTGNYVNGEFDHRFVVYSTLSKELLHK